ncbi:Glycoside hydrolase [Macleaya cordata]|uniref:Beta-amylase n=1 Tax=Macleaya cordata TaxID=56857 RepID=A0A200QXA7_MACCD|nr:Glycoside hydrolase [Macleaya cordata]
MEVSVVGCSQAKIGKHDVEIRELGFYKSNKQIVFSKKNQICFDMTMNRWRRSRIQVAVRAAIQSEASLSEKISEDTTTMTKRSKPEGGVKLYVGLPLDGVSDCNTLNHARAISAGLKALKLLGIKGVELPVWWGIVEKEGMGKYDWSGYIALAKMVQEAGLKLRVSLCFHASKEPAISLPQWVSRIGEAQPDIYFTDRSGRRCTESLSLAVDDLPVLDGKTAMQVYQGFLESFKSSFSAFMGSTITDISIGLGPNGELRYPSYPPARSNQVPGVGEFQCYDKHMLNHLKQHAQAIGNPYWGLTGPHDAPTYYQSPNSNTFFKENGGSWQTPYGHFFLSWYSYQLISHGDRLLSLASSTFCNSPVTISGKVPLVHYWYKFQSHPSEMTAGFYNTNSRDGYDHIAEIFAKNSCKMIIQGMDLSDEHLPSGSFSSPELLLSQIKTACGNHGVQFSGENSSVSGTQDGFELIKQSLLGGNVRMDCFTYQRMGAYFFSPKHFPSFTKFVRSLYQPELHPDDMPTNEEEEEGASLFSKPANNARMQEA